MASFLTVIFLFIFVVQCFCKYNFIFLFGQSTMCMILRLCHLHSLKNVAYYDWALVNERNWSHILVSCFNGTECQSIDYIISSSRFGC